MEPEELTPFELRAGTLPPSLDFWDREKDPNSAKNILVAYTDLCRLGDYSGTTDYFDVVPRLKNLVPGHVGELLYHAIRVFDPKAEEWVADIITLGDEDYNWIVHQTLQELDDAELLIWCVNKFGNEMLRRKVASRHVLEINKMLDWFTRNTRYFSSEVDSAKSILRDVRVGLSESELFNTLTKFQTLVAREASS